MTHFKQFFAGIVLLALIVCCMAAATGTRRPLPETWGTANTGFALDVSGVPNVNIAGTNFSGITTNLSFQRLGGTNTLVIKNGIVTAIQ